MPKKQKLPASVRDHWPEVFDHIDVNVIPIQYLDSVRVEFVDGKIWDIDVKKSLKKTDLDIEGALDELFVEYEDTITNIDFRLNISKVKKDITDRTKTFMKKRK